MTNSNNCSLVLGWSSCEGSHTWSDGPQARLLIQLPSGWGECDRLWLRLQGWVITGPWRAHIFLEDKHVGIIEKSASDPRELDLAIPIPPEMLATGRPAIRVDLTFENTERPYESGRSADPRLLSLALRSVSLEKLNVDADALRKLLEQRPPDGTATAACRDGERVGMQRRLQAAGQTGVLVLGGPVEGKPGLAGPADKLLTASETQPMPPVYRGPVDEMLDALSLSEQLPTDIEFLEIIVLTGDPEFWWQTSTAYPAAYDRIVGPLTATLWPNLINLSRKRSATERMPYGVMTATSSDDGLTFSTEGYSTVNARMSPTIRLFRSLLAEFERSNNNPYHLLIQFDDVAHQATRSVAYCRSQEAADVQLLPDPDFFEKHGYQVARDAALNRRLPPWDARQDMVFWRGSATTSFKSWNGADIERIEQVPRVAMCLAMRDLPGTDMAIMAPWLLEKKLGLEREYVSTWLETHKIFRPAIPMINHTDYRFLVAIDGVASAWSFFEKLLLGSCILKVRSPFEQWFYDGLMEWEHFVPVSGDLADLPEKVQWCRDHQDHCRDIAARGQQFAMRHTYEVGKQAALKAIRRAVIAPDGKV